MSTAKLPPLADVQFDIGGDDDAIHRMTELFVQHGDIYRFHSPARRSELWVVSNPDDVKRVLVSNHRNYTKGIGLDRVKILLGNGIMTSEGDLWKRQRYMMQPHFHRRVITQFAELINDCNDRFIARWEAQAARGELLPPCDETIVGRVDHRREFCNNPSMEERLHHVALAFPQIAFAGHEPLAEENFHPVEAHALGVVAMIRDQDPLHIVRMVHHVDEIGRAHV